MSQCAMKCDMGVKMGHEKIYVTKCYKCHEM